MKAIGFAGRRNEQTCEKTTEFQTAEDLLHHGFVDVRMHRTS